MIIGATGNVGTSLIRALGSEESVTSVVGVARRAPDIRLPKTTWEIADVVDSDLVPLMRGADAVVHLAWLIQPSRDKETLAQVNVEGSSRVFRAAVAAEAPALVYASSVGAYSPGPKDRKVDESWPTEGIQSNYYSRHKAEVERRLDGIEREAPRMRVVRLRPGLIFKRDAAAGIRRLFAGPFLPSPLVRPDLIPIVPRTERLVFQAVHSHCVGEAYRLAVINREAHGAFNIAAEPVLDPRELGRILRARPVRVAPRVLRAAARMAWLARAQPTDPSWVDLALGVPLLDTTRARKELGWQPTRTSGEALRELLEGLADKAAGPTPALAGDGWRAPAVTPVTPQRPA